MTDSTPTQYHLSPITAEPASAALSLKHTNVSQPSLVHSRPSQQSISASEDYYSLSNSGSSLYSVDQTVRGGATESTSTIHRYRTPPERYRTPAQSRTQLPVEAAGVEGDAGEGEEAVRTTPMRGHGKRRASIETAEASSAAAARGLLRGEGGQRRAGVPSTVMEQSPTTPTQHLPQTLYDDADWPPSRGEINPEYARSSMAMQLEREANDGATTPGVDDTPYVRFALDQLTRDEEVRGSRRYPYPSSYAVPGAYPFTGGTETEPQELMAPTEPRSSRYEEEQLRGAGPSRYEEGKSRGAGPSRYEEEQSRGVGPSVVPAAAAGAAAGAVAHEMYQPEQKAMFADGPPPRNPRRLSRGSSPQPQAESSHAAQAQLQSVEQHRPLGGNTFIPISEASQRLDFIPGILRAPQLCIFLFLVLAYVVCLIICAAWSLAKTGLCDYGGIGDGKYFVFEYLPSLLGMILFFWTVQMELAVYRIAPFIAMASQLPRPRRMGARLPMTPHGFVFPYLGHFRAGLPVLGMVVLAAWLQIWTIPLLSSSFNVYFSGSPTAGKWRWIATQGPIWTCIAIYLILAVFIIVLMVWLRRRTTGLRWDPRSLADLAVLLERSNALDGVNDGGEPAQLGFWRTAARSNEIFHTYGITEKAARQYSVEDGRIREEPSTPQSSSPGREFSARPFDQDIERGEQRHSGEKMLPESHGSDEDTTHHGSGLIPWFLRPSMAALWVIIAIVLLLAFLIVSYLQSIGVAKGFAPDVPAPVNKLGYSGTNFLYSFLPALLGMLCLLFWMDIDFAHRRLQVWDALAREHGEVAERSLLVSYSADIPGLVTASAAVNGHYRVALLSFVTLIAATLPILGGGVFWAQFYVRLQKTRISTHMPGFYALTVFCALCAVAYCFIFPSGRLKQAAHTLKGHHRPTPDLATFGGILMLMKQSRILNDVAFHNPASKIDLVTRLLSAAPGASIGVHPEAAASKASLADSVRGFGRARQMALGGLGLMETPFYHLGSYDGRDGRGYWGIDRVRDGEKA